MALISIQHQVELQLRALILFTRTHRSFLHPSEGWDDGEWKLSRRHGHLALHQNGQESETTAIDSSQKAVGDGCYSALCMGHEAQEANCSQGRRLMANPSQGDQCGSSIAAIVMNAKISENPFQIKPPRQPVLPARPNAYDVGLPTIQGH